MIYVPALGQITVDVHAQRSPTVEDCRWEKGLTAFFDALL
jgi:hypothetical protein